MSSEKLYMRAGTALVLFAILLLRFSPVYAKENKDLMKANYYYAHYSYYQAIPYFEKIADTLKTPLIYTHLADCYSITSDLQKAATAYYKAISLPGCDSGVIFRYAQLLMQLSQYDEAEKWLKEYQKSNASDTRTADLIQGCEMAKGMSEDFPSGILTFLACNTDGSDFAPTLWNGKLVFASDTAIDTKKKTDNWTGKSYYNLYSVSLNEKGNSSSDLIKIGGAKDVDIKYHTGPCTFSADGKQMYFTRSKYGKSFLGRKAVANKDSMVVLEIMIASDYDANEKKFNTITPFQYNSSDYAVAHPSISPNGRVLAFTSNMPNGHGRSDIYLCRKMPGNKWSQPLNAGDTVNTEGDELFPYWADDNTLFFSSDGHKGLGGLDIYKCHWNEQDNTFTEPENVGIPVNSSSDDISLAMPAHGGKTWFSSNRPAAKGGDNIYYYKREKIFLKLNVFDSASRKSIANASILLNTMQGKLDTTTDGGGQLLKRLYPEQEYSMEVGKEEYIPKQLTINATSNKEADTIKKDVYLSKVYIPHEQILPQQVVIKHMSVMDTPGVQVFELNQVYEIGHFYYDYNKYELKDAHKVFLDTLLVMLTKHPTMRIEIQAHTDCRGSVALNLTLSNRRALAVVDYLVDHGIQRKRLEYKGLGYSMPAVKCTTCEECTEEQHFLNRILEFKVLQL